MSVVPSRKVVLALMSSQSRTDREAKEKELIEKLLKTMKKSSVCGQF